MSRTIDDKTSEIFKIYDELTKNYSNELDSCKEIIKSVEVMIQQKEKTLHEINERTIQFLKQKIAAASSTPIQEDKIYNYAGVEVENMASQVTQTEPTPPAEANFSAAETILTEPVPANNTRSPRQKKHINKRKGKISLKDLAAGKTEPDGKISRSNKTEKQVQDKVDIKCLFHPEAPLADKQRQLCSVCKWKLITNGLLNHHKDPDVISFLKGELNDSGESCGHHHGGGHEHHHGEEGHGHQCNH